MVAAGQAREFSEFMRKIPIYVFFVIIICVMAGGTYLLVQDTQGPEITMTPPLSRISDKKEITVTVTDKESDIRSITVSIRRDNAGKTLFTKNFDEKAKSQTISFSLADADLTNGSFELEVRGTDTSFAGFGRGNSSTRLFAMVYDTTPPRITIRTMPPYIKRGGSAVIAFTSNKELTKAGIKVDDYYFPAYRQPNDEYICYFAFPYALTIQQYNPQLLAEDTGGNVAVVKPSFYPQAREFKSDTINLSDNFINSKDQEFMADVPGNMSPLDRFLAMNRDVRAANAQQLREIGIVSGPVQKWEGGFMQLPRSAKRADFAEARTYLYNGQEVDHQTHEGLDLAELAQAPVPAANGGTVVHAGWLGIHGNMVVIDHGLGLSSGYSHLSSISVDVGEEVSKGQIVGHTGASGMAGGDHLHFVIFVSGIPVYPQEWLDPHWIKDNVTSRLYP